jgi:hypothetical protein
MMFAVNGAENIWTHKRGSKKRMENTALLGVS